MQDDISPKDIVYGVRHKIQDVTQKLEQEGRAKKALKEAVREIIRGKGKQYPPNHGA